MVDARTRETDDLLRQQLAVEPDVHARAALLGLDYDVIHRAAGRTFIGAQVLPALIGIVCVIAAVVSGVGGSLLEDLQRSLPLVLLGIVPMVVTALSTTLLGGLRSLQPVQRLVAGIGVVNVVQLTTILLLSVVAPDDLSGRLFVAAGLAGTAGILIGAVTRTPDLLLRSNAPSLIDVLRTYEAIPSWQTALGGRSRWLVASSALEVVSVVGLFAVASASLPLAVSVGCVWVSAQILAGYVGLRDNRFGWLAIQGISALAVVAIAVLIG